jgi:hypothetical protein
MDVYKLNVHCERNVPLPLPFATNPPSPATKHAVAGVSGQNHSERLPQIGH